MPRIDEKLYNEVLKYKASGIENFSHLHAIVVDFKNNGGSRFVAYRTFEVLAFEVYDGEDEDIFSIMDLISGWCSRDKYIWPEYADPELFKSDIDMD